MISGKGGEILPSRHFDDIVNLLDEKPERKGFFTRPSKVISAHSSYEDDVHTLIQMYKSRFPEETQDLEYATLRNRVLMVLRVCTWEGGFLRKVKGGYRTIREIDVESDRRKCRNCYRVEKQRGYKGGYEIPKHEQKFVSTYYEERQKSLKEKYPFKEELAGETGDFTIIDDPTNQETESMNTKKDKPEELKELGSAETEYTYDEPDPDLLETFQNQFPHRDYKTEFIFKEFTSLCPKTGQPDFAEIKVEYIPDKLCIETKSLKMYFLSYRQHGSFMETITNNMLEHFVAECLPRWMRITAEFNTRGGTDINVVAEYQKGE